MSTVVSVWSCCCYFCVYSVSAGIGFEEVVTCVCAVWSGSIGVADPSGDCCDAFVSTVVVDAAASFLDPEGPLSAASELTVSGMFAAVICTGGAAEVSGFEYFRSAVLGDVCVSVVVSLDVSDNGV